jgi:fructose-1-phosphate kinase PfkB-like protein
MNSVHYSSKTFVQAAAIAEQIEQLEKQLSALLQEGNSVAVKGSVPEAPPKRRVSVPKKAVESRGRCA